MPSGQCSNVAAGEKCYWLFESALKMWLATQCLSWICLWAKWHLNNFQAMNQTVLDHLSQGPVNQWMIQHIQLQLIELMWCSWTYINNMLYILSFHLPKLLILNRNGLLEVLIWALTCGCSHSINDIFLYSSKDTGTGFCCYSFSSTEEKKICWCLQFNMSPLTMDISLEIMAWCYCRGQLAKGTVYQGVWWDLCY